MWVESHLELCQITNNQINHNLMKIIQLSLTIFDLWSHSHLWVVGWMDILTFFDIFLKPPQPFTGLFYTFSGLSINYDKTEVLRVGSLCNSNAQFYSRLPLVWSDGPVKVLGCEVFPELENSMKHNFDNIIKKVEQIITTWQGRNLSIYGRIQICNTLLMSQAIYKLQVLPPPPDFYERFTRLLSRFIWNNKPPRICYKQLIQDYPNGGLKLQDIVAKNTAMKAIWFTKFKTLSPCPGCGG